MNDAAIKTNEEQRMEALRSYEILDSLSDEEFDNQARLAAEITGKFSLPIYDSGFWYYRNS